MYNFDSQGYLTPYNLVAATMQEVYDNFVLPFATSKTRLKLFEGYKAYNDDLQQTLLDVKYEQWLDGSFVTQKINPKDTDVVTFLPLDVFLKYEMYLHQFEGLNGAKKRYGVDAYFVIIYPEKHTRHAWYLGDKAQWLADFGFSVPSKTVRVYGKRFPKGIIQLSF
jgi:hypothetical protein